MLLGGYGIYAFDMLADILPDLFKFPEKGTHSERHLHAAVRNKEQTEENTTKKHSCLIVSPETSGCKTTETTCMKCFFGSNVQKLRVA